MSSIKEDCESARTTICFRAISMDMKDLVGLSVKLAVATKKHGKNTEKLEKNEEKWTSCK